MPATHSSKPPGNLGEHRTVQRAASGRRAEFDVVGM
jgi:hypothetical protein